MDPREEKEEGELRRSKVMFSKMTDDDRESDDKLASAAKRLVHLMQTSTNHRIDLNYAEKTLNVSSEDLQDVVCILEGANYIQTLRLGVVELTDVYTPSDPEERKKIKKRLEKIHDEEVKLDDWISRLKNHTSPSYLFGGSSPFRYTQGRHLSPPHATSEDTESIISTASVDTPTLLSPISHTITTTKRKHELSQPKTPIKNRTKKRFLNVGTVSRVQLLFNKEEMEIGSGKEGKGESPQIQ